jgi:flagellar biogenesis protein FliO
MSEVLGFMLLRFAIIGGGIFLLILLLGVVVYALKKAGRYDQAKQIGSKALEHFEERRKS